MIYLIAGASHTGKTYLAQKVLEKTLIPSISQDHLKMGLIRSGHINVTVFDDEKLTEVLWPITREMIKTAIENHQNMIIEGCYIPCDWKKDFDAEMLSEIRFIALIMSEKYIHMHEKEIIEYGDVIEKRQDKTINKEELISDNKIMLENCTKFKLPYVFIDKSYDTMNEAMCLLGII